MISEPSSIVQIVFVPCKTVSSVGDLAFLIWLDWQLDNLGGHSLDPRLTGVIEVREVLLLVTTIRSIVLRLYSIIKTEMRVVTRRSGQIWWPGTEISRTTIA